MGYCASVVDGRLRQRAGTRSRLSLSGCNHFFVPSLKTRALVDTLQYVMGVGILFVCAGKLY